MSYASFHEAYGGSFRSKHLKGRGYTLPRKSRLPKEFIRLDPWEAQYLFMLAQLASRGIVEVGRFHGGSTFLLSCANRQVPIWSIDVAPTDDDRLTKLFAENETGANVELISGDSHAGAFPQITEYDLLFIDGDHTRHGCLHDLENLTPGLASGGHLALHDCYAEFQVQQAVLDFTAGSGLTTIRSPYVISSHWLTSFGSFAHFVKPAVPE